MSHCGSFVPQHMVRSILVQLCVPNMSVNSSIRMSDPGNSSGAADSNDIHLSCRCNLVLSCKSTNNIIVGDLVLVKLRLH
jgi:hypothetical protein